MMEQHSPITSNIGILTLSRTFGVMGANAPIKNLLGCSPLPGDLWPLERLFARVDLKEVRQAVEAVFEHGQSFTNLRASLLMADTRSLPCRYNAQPLLGQRRRVIGIIFSFCCPPQYGISHTGYDLNSQAVTLPPINARGLFENLPQGSFTVDARWHITTFNRAAEQITGFSRKEALGRKCWEIFRSDLCRRQCPMQQAMDQQCLQTDRQVFSINRNGLRRALSVNVNILKNAHGEILGAVETFHPVGEDRASLIAAPGRMQEIIGNSPSMRAIFAMLPDVAASRANVLITGESGTGKELIARTLHNLSGQAGKPFVAVNCAALPESLLEAELFGHEKGAFTGAKERRIGRFELAGLGTVLLDEIAEFRPELQVKLLRVIEQRSFERVGGVRSIPFGARLISATHQNLEDAIRQKQFREDLYYRLRTVTLTLPPLRHRPEDIPLLVNHFITKFNAKTGKNVRSLDPKVMTRFMAHTWPGNVRELAHCIEHAFVFVKGPVIFQRYLPDLDDTGQPPGKPAAITCKPLPSVTPIDKQMLLQALARTDGKRQAAARLLGISRTSMWRRMKAAGLL